MVTLTSPIALTSTIRNDSPLFGLSLVFIVQNDVAAAAATLADEAQALDAYAAVYGLAHVVEGERGH